MVTNRSLNGMFKPNNVSGEFTKSTGAYADVGIRINDGKFNHQTAMVFDVIYDHLFRTFNQIEGTSFLSTSLSRIIKNDEKRYEYFRNLLTDRKMRFYDDIKKFLTYSKSLEIVPNSSVLIEMLSSHPEFIKNAFPFEFSVPFLQELEEPTNGNLNKVVELLKTYDFEKTFFRYTLEQTFRGRIPQWNSYNVQINLNDVFKENERSIYVLKKFFEESKSLRVSLTYPVTCFFDVTEGQYVPKNPRPMTVLHPIEDVHPFTKLECDKSSMKVTVSLSNKFMAFFAHDAKMCVKTIVPSKLYSLNSNEFFLGKHILNNS